jgi:hypothetical protein
VVAIKQILPEGYVYNMALTLYSYLEMWQEDKVLQRSVTEILYRIYEERFFFVFRLGFYQDEDALEALVEAIESK